MTLLTKRKILKKAGFSIDTNPALGTDDTKVPSQKAVKEFVEANAGGVSINKTMAFIAAY